MHATRLPLKATIGSRGRRKPLTPLPLPRRRASLFFCLSAKKKKKKTLLYSGKARVLPRRKRDKRDPGLSAPSALRWPAVDNAPIRCSALRNAIPFTGETRNYVKSRRWRDVCACVYVCVCSIIRGRWKSGTHVSLAE